MKSLANRYILMAVWWAVVLVRPGTTADLNPIRAPQPFLVEGLPSGLRQFWSVAETPLGWVAATTDAMVIGVGANPTIVRPPTAGLCVVLPHPRGLLTGGDGFCSLYSNNTWIPLAIKDDVYKGLSMGSYALIVARHGIYQVDPLGNALLLREISDQLGVLCAKMKDDYFVFTKTQGIFRWRPNALEPAGERFSFLKFPCFVFSVQDLGEKGWFFATSEGYYLWDGRNAISVYEKACKQTRSEGVIGVHLLGNILFVTTYFSGVYQFDRVSGEEICHIPPESIGGNIYCSQLEQGGLLVGTSSGLYMLLDESDLLRSSAVNPGDPQFAGHYSFGDVIGTTSGLYFPSGKIFPLFRPKEGVFSLLELQPGKFVIGGWGRVYWAEKQIIVPGRNLVAIDRISDTQFVTLQPDVAYIVSTDGNVARLPVPAAATNLGVDEKGWIWVATIAGGYAFNGDGKLLMKRGDGVARILSTGSTLHVLDAAGHLFDSRGEYRATLPFHHAIGAAALQGKLWVLAQFDNLQTWLGAINLDTYEWTPVDVPLPHPATHIFASEDALRVVGPTSLITVRDPGRLAPPQLNSVRLIAGDRTTSGSLPLNLSADETSLDLQLPLPRLGPWSSPMFSMKVGEDPVEEVQGRVHIARLPAGVTKIQLRADAGGLSSSANYRVYRAPHGWARWPALLLYAVLAGGFAYGLVRFRLQRLQQRALDLEKKVNERTAELHRAQKLRETFFITLSHEIRNPLNGVVGLAEVLADAPRGAVAPRERGYLQSLKSCAEQLRTILDDVLDFARIDRGEIPINEGVFEVNSAIDGSARAISPRLEDCILNLPTEPHWLRGDAGKIRQVISNLISNAIKYGRPPRATVTVTLREAAETTVLTVTVENTGPDIPSAQLKTIFDEFTRGDDAVARNISGSGLGLAVSRRLAKVLGGTLEATSGGGRTCFRFRVPLAPAVKPLSIMCPGEKRPRSKALAIEDMQYNRDVLGHLLESLDYDVDWAIDGASALEHVQRTRYEIIFIDMALPDISGPELARRLLDRSQAPKPPMVAVTAYSTLQKMNEAQAAGITGFVCKPVSKQKLQEAIQQACKHLPPRAYSVANSHANEWMDGETGDFPNLAYIRSIADGNLHRFRQLAKSLGEQLEIETQKIIGLAAVEDFSELEKIVHRIQPLVAALGCAAFGTAIDLCRDAAEENDGVKLRAASSELEYQLSRVQQHLTNILELSPT